MSSKVQLNTDLENIPEGGRVGDLVRYGKVFSPGLTNCGDNLGHWFPKYAPQIPRDSRPVPRGTVDTFLYWLL
jgi:hypothetical protein